MKLFGTAIFAAFALFSGSVMAQAPAASTATSAESPEIRELQKVEDSWSSALNQRDQYGLELVLSPSLSLALSLSFSWRQIPKFSDRNVSFRP